MNVKWALRTSFRKVPMLGFGTPDEVRKRRFKTGSALISNGDFSLMWIASGLATNRPGKR